MIATRRKIYTDKILDNLLGAQKKKYGICWKEGKGYG